MYIYANYIHKLGGKKATILERKGQGHVQIADSYKVQTNNTVQR